MEPIKEESESPNSTSPISRIPESSAESSGSGLPESSAEVKIELAEDLQSEPGDKTWAVRDV